MPCSGELTLSANSKVQIDLSLFLHRISRLSLLRGIMGLADQARPHMYVDSPHKRIASGGVSAPLSAAWNSALQRRIRIDHDLIAVR